MLCLGLHGTLQESDGTAVSIKCGYFFSQPLYRAGLRVGAPRVCRRASPTDPLAYCHVAASARAEAWVGVQVLV